MSWSGSNKHSHFPSNKANTTMLASKQKCEAAMNLEFEEATRLRDEVKRLQQKELRL